MAESKKKSGKSFALFGFVLAIISLGGYYFAGNMANIEAVTKGGGTIVMLLWALLCATAFILSFAAFRRSSLGTKSLATVGMIISVFTFLMSLWSASSIYQAASNPELQRLRDQLGSGYDEELNKLKNRLEKKEIIVEEKKDSI